MKPIFSECRRPSRALVLALALGVLSTPRVAFAQSPSAGDLAQARELLNQGLDLRSRGDATGALEKLKTANALAHTPVTGLELGRTYMAIGQLVEARETFLSVARMPTRPEETQRSSAARVASEQMAEQLRPRLASLTVRVVGAPRDSLSVTIDGVAVPNEALEAPRLVNPRSHVVTAKSAGGGAADANVDLQEGESRGIELHLVSPVGAATTAPPSPPEGPRPRDDGGAPPSRAPSRVLPWSLVGGGAAGAAAGVVFMLVETSRASDANNRHDRIAYDGTKTPWAIGLVGTLAGGAAVAAGALVFVLQRPASEHASRAPVWMGVGVDGVRIGGAF